MVGVSRTAYQYHHRTPVDAAFRERLKEFASKYPRDGYLMLHSLLKNDGLVVNKKRTYRFYSKEGLQVAKKRKKLLSPRLPMTVSTAPKRRWSMDFVSDQLSNGRRLRVMNVVGDISHEMIGEQISVSISGQLVARLFISIA